MSARRIGQALTLVVLVTSATYLLVYLYRWEWNRALVAGLFFLAAEVAVIGSSILGRLRTIERRLDERPGPAPADTSGSLARIQEAAPPAKRRFAWLDEATRSMNVFVPVLLGAGVILSLLATLVERIAGATATPVLERHLADRLRPLAVEPGDLRGQARATPAPAPHARAARLLVRTFVVAVAVLGVAGTFQAVDLVADATQTRSDPVRHDASIELTLRVDTKGRAVGPHETAEALWVACRGTLNRLVVSSEPRRVSDHVVLLKLRPAFGDHARRRLKGCLEDATLDRTTGSVVRLVEVLDR